MSTAYVPSDWNRMMHELTRLQKEVQRLREALEEIADPVAALRDGVPPGHDFDAAAAIRLSEMPSHLKNIARRALAEER